MCTWLPNFNVSESELGTVPLSRSPLMREFVIRLIAMVSVQPLAFFWFLWVSRFGWLISATLATLVAVAIGVTIYLFQTWTKEEQ